MDLNNSNLAQDLECPVCLDVYDKPKLLICGHTVCQTCVGKVVAAQQTAANGRERRDGSYIKCPECTVETKIPADGLTTNYRLVDLVRRAQKPRKDARACNSCGKRAPLADMFTCDTCQEALNIKPLWFCALCAMKQHRSHAMSGCDKATAQEVQEACQGIADSSSSADMYVGLTMSHLSGALEKIEIISQALNQKKCGFPRLEARAKGADNNLTQEDLAASVQAATELKQQFEQASASANDAGKALAVLEDFRKKLEELFPKEQAEEPVEAEDSGSNDFDLRKFDFDEEVINLSECGIDAIPDLSRFTELRFLNLGDNLLTSISVNITPATLTRLDLGGNQITEIRGLDALVNLEALDVGNNRLRKIEGLANLVKLRCIYLQFNSIEKIRGLDTLVNLELLNLGGNRLKKLKGLTNLVKLKELYLKFNRIEKIEGLDNQHNLIDLRLGENKIRRIENISHLSKLRVLHISGNLITKLENLDALVELETLYVAAQRIESFDGVQKLKKLKEIDAGKNSIASLHHMDQLQTLESLWLNDNKISEWTEVDQLAQLAKLRTVYLGGNPIQTRGRVDYRRRAIQALPQVTELDGTPCR